MHLYKNLSILLITMFFTANSFAQSGNDLLGYCDNYSDAKASFTLGVCAGMVLAISDYSKKICIPEGVTNKQRVLVVEKFLKNNPQELHYSAHSLIEYSLEIVWPCKKQ